MLRVFILFSLIWGITSCKRSKNRYDSGEIAENPLGIGNPADDLNDQNVIDLLLKNGQAVIFADASPSSELKLSAYPSSFLIPKKYLPQLNAGQGRITVPEREIDLVNVNNNHVISGQEYFRRRGLSSTSDSVIEFINIRNFDLSPEGLRIKPIIDDLNGARNLFDPANTNLAKNGEVWLHIESNFDAGAIVARLNHQFQDRYHIYLKEQDLLDTQFTIAITPKNYKTETVDTTKGPVSYRSFAREEELRTALNEDNFLGNGEAIAVVSPKPDQFLAGISSPNKYENLGVATVSSNRYSPLLNQGSHVAIIRKKESTPAAMPPRQNIFTLAQQWEHAFSRDFTHQVPNFLAKNPVYNNRVIGEGNFGKVYEMQNMFGEKFAYKSFTDPRDRSNNIREISFAIVLGELNIGPKVYYASAKGSELNYTMQFLKGDAYDFRMSEDQIRSYGTKMLQLRDHGLVSLDNKLENILLADKQAYMHDFGSVHTISSLNGRVPPFDAWHPPESRLRDRISDYDINHALSFDFGLNTIWSRMKDKESMREFLEYDVYVQSDKLIQALQGRHHEFDFTETQFRYLLRMIQTDYKQRPSIEGFLSL